MYTYTCFLHAHVCSKYAYAYNWASHVGPMYAYAYSCPETIIRTFLLLFLYFIFFNMPLSALVFYVYESLPPCFVVVCSLHVRLEFLFYSLFGMP